MTLTGEDITGQKRTAYNPKNAKATPSLMESLIHKVSSNPNPPEQELYVRDKPPDNEAVVRGFINRSAIVKDAMTLSEITSSSEDLLKRVCDAIFNDGISMENLQKIATLEISEESAGTVMDILDTAKLLDGEAVATLEQVAAVIVIARAIIRHVMTHHGGHLNTGEFKYESGPKTPFQAWRVKEAVQGFLANSEPILVNPGGFDSTKQVKQFYANFISTDLVLWSHDIWKAAIRGCSSFIDTPITKDIIDSVTPMFWQFDRPFTLGDDFNVHRGKYECVGFGILPTTEEMVKVEFGEDAVVEFTPSKKNSNSGFVTVDTDDPAIKKAFDAARTNPVKFDRRGISVAVVFLPLVDKTMPPEIRFMKPMFEDENIESMLGATIIAGLKFLTLKYVAKDTVGVAKKELKEDRALFKKVRHGKVQIPPIKVINLRRPEVRKRKEKEGEETRHINWTCHFIVDAHWRKQWYPSERRNKIKRIGMYIKGDLSKPFHASREKVYKAVR